MNIFFLSEDARTAAQWHVDKHVVKMPLEAAQLLCTAHHLAADPFVKQLTLLYKATHKNHPSAIWVRASRANYNWAYSYFAELAEEYTYRYGKQHASWTKLKDVLKAPPCNTPDAPFTPPPQCMPDIYKCANTSTAYRNYYNFGKKELHAWRKREAPHWVVAPFSRAPQNILN